MKSLLSLFSSLATFNRMETLFNVLNCTCRLAILACKVLKTGARITSQFRIQFLTIQTPYVKLQVLLVQVCDVFVLIFSDQDKVSFRTKVALYVKLCLQEIKNVLRFTLDSLANGNKISPCGFCWGELACFWILTPLLLFFFIVGVLCITRHNFFNTLEKECVLVFHVSFNTVQVEIHWKK